jgi:hypothetical protein
MPRGAEGGEWVLMVAARYIPQGAELSVSGSGGVLSVPLE